MKVIIRLKKGRAYSGAVDNVMGVICKDSKGEIIPNVWCETNPSPHDRILEFYSQLFFFKMFNQTIQCFLSVSLVTVTLKPKADQEASA